MNCIDFTSENNSEHLYSETPTKALDTLDSTRIVSDNSHQNELRNKELNQNTSENQSRELNRLNSTRLDSQNWSNPQHDAPLDQMLHHITPEVQLIVPIGDNQTNIIQFDPIMDTNIIDSTSQCESQS